MRDLVRNTKHYTPLLLLFIVGLICMLLFKYDRVFQIATAFALSASYLTWGIIHHKIHDDYDMFVFLEYLAVSILGLVIVLSLLYRS